MFKNLRRVKNKFFAKDKEFLSKLQDLLGFTPANLSIFQLAFSHRSNSNGHNNSPNGNGNEKPKTYGNVQNNERLEYLGDAILGTIVAEYLFKKYPHADEGFLTKMRSKIVKRKSLNLIGEKMGLDLILSSQNNTRLSRSMLGNAVEALVGAIYLELGYHGTKRYLIRKVLMNYLDIHELESVDDNYKSQLLEWCQKNGQNVSYKLIARYKYEKRDRFKVAVMINGKKIATADDFNKKSAEQTASERAMQKLGILTVEPAAA